jgi:pimeloyl-ACP methyl ester carboxylesterase
MSKSRSGKIDGTAYEIAGQGPAVLLVHGLGMNRAMWQWQLPALVDDFTVVTYDLLGHGESKAPPEDLTLTHLSEQLYSLCEALEFETCGVAGFSLGGMIARRFALDHPDKLEALAILNSAHDRTPEERTAILRRVAQAAETGPTATVGAALARWFTEKFRESHGDVMDLVQNWILANDPAVYPRVYRVLAEGDEEIASTITKITWPTLVMTAEEDYGNSADMARRMAALIPNSELVILPGLRHMALAEDPAAFNAPLVDFFEKTLTGKAI